MYDYGRGAESHGYFNNIWALEVQKYWYWEILLKKFTLMTQKHFEEFQRHNYAIKNNMNMVLLKNLIAFKVISYSLVIIFFFLPSSPFIFPFFTFCPFSSSFVPLLSYFLSQVRLRSLC